MEKNKKIQKIVSTIEEIPTIPLVTDYIQKLFKSEEVTFKQVLDLVEKDPPLALKVLRLANSSFYGFINNVGTVERALILLGFNEVRNIVIGFSMQKHFNGSGINLDMKRFWRHAIVCSLTAKYLGKYFDVLDDGSFFLSGLMHDIGKLIIAQYFKEDFSSIIDYVTENRTTFSKAEKHVLGTTHYQIAASLLQQWKIPNPVVMQVFYHHAPWHDKNNTSASIVAFLANIFTKLEGFTCVDGEESVEVSKVLTPPVIDFLNKNGFELDEASFNKIASIVGEFIAQESGNALKMFE